MTLQPRPELAQLNELAPAGVAINVGALGPSSSGGKASFVRVVRITTPKPPLTGNILQLWPANGSSYMTLTTWAGFELWVEFTEIGKNTTCDTVQVGWY
jgi:hypothetical protein